MFTISMTKTCKDCGLKLSIYAFKEAPDNWDGYATRCRGCDRRNYKAKRAKINMEARAYRQTEHGRAVRKYYRRKYSLKAKYGLSPEQHEQMYVDQEGRCLICCETVLYEKVHTDHDHKTGEVRGLLCQSCNHLLGGARDNPSILQAAIEYLNAPKPGDRRINPKNGAPEIYVKAEENIKS